MTRTAFAAVLGGLGLALGIALLATQTGVTGGASPQVHLEDATAAQLDTVSVRGRVVQVSMDGVVTQLDADGRVWLGAGGDAFPLRFPEAPGVAVEDRVLVTGRLRARGGQRWLAVTDWARVHTEVRPPPSPQL